jgi:hypothetical protein
MDSTETLQPHWFDGVFLLVTSMWLAIDPLWQTGTVLAALGAPLMLLP